MSTGKGAADVSKGRRGASGDSSAASPQAQTGSSRASSASPDEQKKAQIDFQFLNFSHPSQAKAGKTLKVVRSHVTKQQHQRENAAAAARRSRDRSKNEKSLAASSYPNNFESQSPEASSSLDPYDSTTSTTVSSPAHRSPPLSPNPLLLRQIDPLEIYPEAWHAYVPRILDHYFTNLAVDIPYIDGSESSGLLKTRFFPFALTDLASMHAVMLFGASHYGRYRGSTSHAIDLLQLRGMAIREINVALEDEARATSDQLIVAVAKMAAYEAIFGDADIFNTHMIGLSRMVSLRGGLPALGLDGLLERVLLWIDANASSYMNIHVYFDKKAFPAAAAHPVPDIATFTGGLA